MSVLIKQYSMPVTQVSPGWKSRLLSKLSPPFSQRIAPSVDFLAPFTHTHNHGQNQLTVLFTCEVVRVLAKVHFHCCSKNSWKKDIYKEIPPLTPSGHKCWSTWTNVQTQKYWISRLFFFLFDFLFVQSSTLIAKVLFLCCCSSPKYIITKLWVQYMHPL